MHWYAVCQWITFDIDRNVKKNNNPCVFFIINVFFLDYVVPIFHSCALFSVMRAHLHSNLTWSAERRVQLAVCCQSVIGGQHLLHWSLVQVKLSLYISNEALHHPPDLSDAPLVRPLMFRKILMRPTPIRPTAHSVGLKNMLLKWVFVNTVNNAFNWQH